MTDPLSPPTVTDHFLDNLSALWVADPALAMALDRLDDSQRLATEPARSGARTARAVGPDGVPRYLHSKYDPAREAAALVDANIRQDALCYVVFGCGLGYALAELLARLPEEAAVVVVEPDLPTLATALEVTDLAEPIRAARLTFVTAAEPGHIHEQLTRHNLRIIAGTRLVTLPTADALAGPFMAAARGAIMDFISFTRMGVLTLLLNNERTLGNVLNNLDRYVACPPLNGLRGRFAGYPAVVVAAGPSLHARLATLKKMAPRAVIVAVQTALRPLIEAGVPPHFVTTLDYGEIGQRFFQGLPADALANVHMVAEPKAHPKVIDAFVEAQCPPPPAADAATSPVKGEGFNAPSRGEGFKAARISMLGNEHADRILGEAANPPNDRLLAGATVAHLSFYLAQYLGCDPIIFVGQDLGFSNGTYYTPGTAIHQIWAGELNRFNSIESMEWQRIVRDPQALRKLVDVHGRPIYTDEQMFTYLKQFERDFAVAPQRIIDATGGGVRKAGTTVMDLDTAAEQFATRPLPADARTGGANASWWNAARLAGAAAALDKRIDQVEQLEKVCARTMELLDRLVGLLTTDLAEFNRTVAQIDEQRLWVRQHQDVLTLVIQVSQVAEFQRYTADRSLKISRAEGIEKRKFQLARDRAYVSAIRDGCGRLLALLRPARERLGRHAET